MKNYSYLRCFEDNDDTILIIKTTFLYDPLVEGLRRLPVTQEITGSNPVWIVCIFFKIQKQYNTLVAKLYTHKVFVKNTFLFINNIYDIFQTNFFLVGINAMSRGY